MDTASTSLTVQNADNDMWLATLTFHNMGQGQQMSFSLLRNQSAESIPEMQYALLKQAHALIGRMIAGEGVPNK